MTCWIVLGLPPDADSRTIKRQYATLLKKTRPDDDPEGFQRLREAYEEALNWQQWSQEQDSCAVAVEAVPTLLATDSLQQRYQQAVSHGNGLAFEVALLQRCITDDVSDADLRWAFETFQWLSAWQRLELPQDLTEALANRCKKTLQYGLALAMAERDEAAFLAAYATRMDHPWLNQPANAQWFNQMLATLLTECHFWSPVVFEAVRAGQAWHGGNDNTCPADEWQHLLRRQQGPVFMAHQRALAAAAPDTPQQRAARLLLAPMTMGQRRAFAQRLSEDDWDACRALAATLKADQPDVALGMPGGTPYFWQDWETAVDSWPLLLATVLGCVAGALFQAPSQAGVLVSTAGAAIAWSMAYLALGALAWQVWRPLAHRLRVLDEGLAAQLPHWLSPSRLPLLPVRDLIPGAVMSAAVSIQFGPVAGLTLVAVLAAIGMGKRRARMSYKQWASVYPRRAIASIGVGAIAFALAFTGLKFLDSHHQVNRNQGLQQWVERVCSRMPQTAEQCQAPATHAQWYDQEAPQ